MSPRLQTPARTLPARTPTSARGHASSRSHVGGLLAALVLIATGPQVLAEGECQLGFEKWAKMSAARLHTSANDSRGPCIQNEGARKALLDGLARSKATCEEDASAPATKEMIDANANFIRAVGVCEKQENAAATANWTTHLKAPAAPAPPAAPPPMPAAAPPIPTVAPRVAAAPAPPKSPAALPRDCLELQRATADRYTLANRHCAGHIVIAVVETRNAQGITACKAYSIRDAITVGESTTANLRVNHECVLNRGICTSRHIGDMFPECDW